jgi:predicted enzyme related to lactoylglutathione lyase
MEIKPSHFFVTVHDQDQALAFYRDALGLQVHTDATLDGFRWLTVSAPSQPDVEIVLTPVRTDLSPEDQKTTRELMVKGSLYTPLFVTDDVDMTFEKVRASGAEVLQEPIDQPYGTRDCAFRDPSGNPVRIMNPLRPIA